MLGKNTVNKVILMGRIGKEPSWHNIDGQRTLCFSVVTIDRLKSATEPLYEDWHEICVPEYLMFSDKLGLDMMVYIQGRLRTKMFIDPNKVKHYRTEVIATSVDIIDLVPAAYKPEVVNQ